MTSKLRPLRILLPVGAAAVVIIECGTGVFQEQGLSDWLIAIPTFIAIAIWLRDEIRDIFPPLYFLLVRSWLYVRNAEADVELHTRVGIEVPTGTSKPDWEQLESELIEKMTDLAPKTKPEFLKETARKRMYRVKGVGTIILEKFAGDDEDRPRLGLYFEDMHLTYQKASRTLKQFVTPLLVYLIGRPCIDGESFGFDLNIDLGREHPFLKLLKHHWSPALKEAVTLDVEIRGKRNVVRITDKNVVMHGVGQEVVVDTLRKLLALDLTARGVPDGT